MSHPISNLFTPVPRDDVSTLWGPRFEVVNATGAAIQIASAIAAVPTDRTFWISGFNARAIPGAGQNVSDIVVEVRDEQGGVQSLIRSLSQAGAANVTLDLGDECDICLPSGFFLVAEANFNAGVAANTVEISAHGVYTVRGNIALF